MKSFKTFSEDGMGGSAVGGIAGTGDKAGEPGVSISTQKKIQKQGGQSSLHSRAYKVRPVDTTSSPRRVTKTSVGFPLAKTSYSEETKKQQKIITKQNSKTDSIVKKTSLNVLGFDDFLKGLKNG